MLENEPDLLAIRDGAVTAPAGCGKTQLIAEAVRRHNGAKPILVLTHTNAGVAALRGRLHGASVPSARYRLATIDGWALRLISAFPARSGHSPDLLSLADPNKDYPKIRDAAAGLLKSSHIDDVIAASYARVIIDEYQDCSIGQHEILTCAARAVPTCVLGDPLQAIFDFGDNVLAGWDDLVRKHFPIAGSLSTPWRWINAGREPLGTWLLEVRKKLLCGEAIDLRSAPPDVVWIELDGTDDRRCISAAAAMRPADSDGKVLIIGDSRNAQGRYRLASQTPGVVTIEAVELRDLMSFARNLDLTSPNALAQVLRFAQLVMTGVGSGDVLKRVSALSRGTARTPASGTERLALAFTREPTYDAAQRLLLALGDQSGTRRYRPGLLSAGIAALRQCDGTEGNTLVDAALRVREQYRLVGRPLPKRGVGSTLLLKGLEADMVVILDADQLSVRNLYVALTRGSKSLVVCSREPVLRPS